MTQEEYEQEQQEIARLINEINYLIEQNNMLAAEIETAIQNIRVLEHNIGVLHKNFEPQVRILASEVGENNDYVVVVLKALEEMTERFFTFKNISTASKNVTQFTDEYYTKFSYYNNLRRITLGYVVGLDANFVNSKKMRSIVEKAYLQNTEYWLAYATMAMMLWASDEQEAAKRALDKAMFINQKKASLFFMLINLRFSRQDTAYRWFIRYVEQVNPNNLDDEWQYLLQAYLTGAFGDDDEFRIEIASRMKDLLAQAEATSADMASQAIRYSYSFADAYLHKTSESFSYLSSSCQEYGEMMELLSNAEKNALIAEYYGKLFEEEEDAAQEIAQRIENVLYSLVNSYDDDELVVVKRIKKNEAVLAAQGDVTAAQKNFLTQFPEKKKKNFADLLLEWAFSQDSNLTPVCVRKFSVGALCAWIKKGYQKFVNDYREKERDTYTFDIDGCVITCGENDLPAATDTLNSYYEQNTWKNVLKDKLVVISAVLALAGLLFLTIMGLRLPHTGFNTGARVVLVIGVLLVLIGVFLFWRQSVAVKEKLKEKQRLGQLRLQHSIEELASWREAYHRADAHFEDLIAALEQFEQKEM